MPVNTLHASFVQRFNQLLLIQPTTNAKSAGSSATAHRGGHCHQAAQTNPQPPTGDARYGLSSLIVFFPHSLLLFILISPVHLHYLDIHLHAPHLSPPHTTPDLTPVPPPHLAQHNSSSLS